MSGKTVHVPFCLLGDRQPRCFDLRVFIKFSAGRCSVISIAFFLRGCDEHWHCCWPFWRQLDTAILFAAARCLYPAAHVHLVGD